MKERSNEEWLGELRLAPPGCNEAMQALRERLLAGLTVALAHRPGVDSDFLEDQAQEALLRILDRLDTFRGESRFLTWAHKVAVRLTLTELRKRRWRDVSLDAFEGAENMFASAMEGPEEGTVRKELLTVLSRAIQEDLTEKQRLAMTAIRFHGMPMEEVARRMGTHRNSLYKLMHDARLRLKGALLEKGLSAEEILESFR